MRIILFVQAVYYLITGLWPIVSLRSFEAVTGPKTDDWLVQMVGLLAAAIGTTLLFGSWRGSRYRETLALAILGAISFTAIDVIFAVNGTIGRICLADAVVQVIVISALLGTSLLAPKKVA